MSDNKKVVKYRRPFHINIGVIIFAVILFYVMFYVYSYFTTQHTSCYEVVNGTIALNNSYKGLAIRQETIINSDYSGYINYYISDSTKAGAGDLVCSVDSTGQISSQINSVDNSSIIMQKENLSQVKEKLENFGFSYSNQDFHDVYSFKSMLEDQISELININALDDILSSTSVDTSSFTQIYTPTDGVVTYYQDGYEDLTIDTFSAENYDPASYTSVNLKQSEQISAGSPLYRLTTNENWNLIVPIDSDTLSYLQDKSAIEIKFDDDGVLATCPFTIFESNGSSFLNINVRTGMIRYADERYINIELVLDEEKGLKIPNSAIVKKDFYTIPKECFSNGGDSSNLGLLIQRTDADGNVTTEFIDPTIYYETEDEYYVDGEDINRGDIIVLTDSSTTYTVDKTDQLKGVYNINKGYAIFKQVDIIYQNDDYTIIKSGTDYGVSLYDHIALDSSTIIENAIVN